MPKDVDGQECAWGADSFGQPCLARFEVVGNSNRENEEKPLPDALMPSRHIGRVAHRDVCSPLSESEGEVLEHRKRYTTRQ